MQSVAINPRILNVLAKQQADLVKTRRERTTIFYSLNGDKIVPFMSVMHDMFCKVED